MKNRRFVKPQIRNESQIRHRLKRLQKEHSKIKDESIAKVHLHIAISQLRWVLGE